MQNVIHYLAVYEIDRAYGGPEEGGWWYNTGALMYCEPVAHDATPETVDARREALRAEWFDADARPVGSVAYTGGWYAVTLETGIPEAFYPSLTPRYE